MTKAINSLLLMRDMIIVAIQSFDAPSCLQILKNCQYNDFQNGQQACMILFWCELCILTTYEFRMGHRTGGKRQKQDENNL